MPSPNVSVVLLNFNGRAHLAEALSSLAEDGWPRPDVEVVVADNGSTDGSEEMVRANFPAAIFAPSGRNLGFAGGVRFGVERSRGGILVFLNNDARVERGWLDALVSALEGAPDEVAAVVGRLTSWGGDRVDYRDTLLTFDGHAFQRDFGRPLAAVADDPPGSERLAPCGGNMAIRRESFLDAGGFDEDFFAYLEDVDLGLRLRARGSRIVYEPRAVARHHSGATGEALGLYNRGFLIEKNALAVVWKNWDDEAFRAFLPAVLATLVHRTTRLVRERAEGGERIAVDPYREPNLPGEDPTERRGRSAEPVSGLRRRLLRLVARLLGLPPAAAAPESMAVRLDPHSLCQMRALHRFFADLPRLEEKRRKNLALARVPTREIFARWPPAVVPTYPGDEEFFGTAAFRRLLPDGWPLESRPLGEVMELG